LGKCLIKESKYQEAEDLYLKAVNEWKADPSKGGNEARASLALGSLYIEEKKYAAAAPVLEHALRLAEQSNGPLSVALVPYLQKYAYAVYFVGNRSEVEQLRARASSIACVVQALKPACKMEAGIWPDNSKKQ
jgi:tetratricopeptide (TPR) repeat protein